MTSTFEVYVTFSGEGQTPIDNVKALSSTGMFLGDVLPADVVYTELRGITLFDGLLFVAQAYKCSSAILAFGPVNTANSARELLGTLIDSSCSAALWHPYGLSVSGTRLFVSSQDSNVVTAYDIKLGPQGQPSGSTAEIARFLATKYAGQTFLPGTWVASSTAVTVGTSRPIVFQRRRDCRASKSRLRHPPRRARSDPFVGAFLQSKAHCMLRTSLEIAY